MATVGIIAIVIGIILFVVSGNISTDDKSLRNGAIIITIGGVVGGCFATPSRDMPNGMPGATILSIAFIILGIFIIIKKFIFTKKGGENKSNSTPILVVVGIILFILVIVAFISSENSPNTNEPWKDLGVSEKEYMEIYNYYKYGEHSH